MFGPKLFLLAVLFIGVNSRYVYREEFRLPHNYLDDGGNILLDDPEDALSEQPYESVYPAYLEGARVRRQAGSVVLNSDGTSSMNMGIPLIGNDKNGLSAFGGVDFNNNLHLASATAGLALENVNGHQLALSKTHIPSRGDQLSAVGKLNLFNNEDHNLDAKAFFSRNQPSMPHARDYNTYGGGLDYMYKEKLGANVGISRTPLFDQTDYSAGGTLNLFKNKDSSLDFNAGWKKSESPFIHNSNWEPNAGFSFTKRFRNFF